MFLNQVSKRVANIIPFTTCFCHIKYSPIRILRTSTTFNQITPSMRVFSILNSENSNQNLNAQASDNKPQIMYTNSLTEKNNDIRKPFHIIFLKNLNILEEILKLKQESKALAFIHDQILPSISECSEKHVTMLLCKVSRFSYSKFTHQIFNMVKNEVGTLNSYHYNTLLKIYKDENNLDKCLEIFEIMKQNNLISETSYNILLEILVRNDKTSLTIDVFSKMRADPQIKQIDRSFNAVLRKLISCGLLIEAIKLFEEEKQIGIFPNILACTALIDAVMKNGNFEKSLELFEDMKIHNIAPNLITYTSIIDGYSRSGKFSEVFALIDEMNANNIPPSIATFTAIIQSYLKFYDIDQLDNIISLMQKYNIPFGIKILNVILGILIEHKNYKIDKVVNIYDSLILKYNISENANLDTFNKLIKGFIKEGQKTRALGILNIMKRKQIMANTTTFKILLQSGSSGEKYLIKLFHEMKENKVIISSDLKQILLKLGYYATAVSILNE